jgi:DNA-binding NarL/FixJ family response regulator
MLWRMVPHPPEGADTDPVSEPRQRLRVVFADDHEVYRQSMAERLEQCGIDVVAVAGNGVEAISAVEQHAPDVVVVDLRMPDMSGVAVARRLAERAPASRILVISVSAEEADVTDALQAGARGYVLKDSPVEHVVAGIEAAAAGVSLISQQLASSLLRRARERAVVRPVAAAPPLSKREVEVLELVASGKSNHEIGTDLFIGQRAVRNHISSILTKLQMETRVQAAVQDVRNHTA